jgi:hypothetical protein
VEQAHHQVRILVAPSRKTLVEAVYALQVAAPDGQVAALDAAPGKAVAHAPQVGPAQAQLQGLVEVAAQAPGQARGDGGGGNRDAFVQHAPRQALAHQDAAARHQAARLRQRAVAGDEVALRDAVAVQEDDVVAVRGQGAAVARHRRAKALVGLPDVANRHRRALCQPFYAVARVGSRAIISDNDFEILVVLHKTCPHHRFQRVRPVVGGDHDRDCLCMPHRVRCTLLYSGARVSHKNINEQ